MILQALHRLADAEGLVGDPDYLYKPVSWAVRLRGDGSLVGIEDLRHDLNAGTGRKAKWVGKAEPVPFQPTRTSGAAAFFLVDKAEYALGVDPVGERPDVQLAERVGLFRQQVADCAAEVDDPAIGSVLAFLDGVALRGERPALPDGAAANELFAFRVGEGGFVHLRPAVRAYWKSTRSPAELGAAGATFRCLVTGEPVGEVGGFPLVKRLPGGTPSGVALVSHNAGAFESHGLKGSGNAPVGRAAAEAVAVALNRLLDPNPLDGRGEKLARRHVRLSGDTAMVYWSPEASADPAVDCMASLLEAESPEAVADAYRSVWRGRPAGVERPEAFYAMTITGTQGRAVVRDWLESTVGEAVSHLARHFADLDVVRNTRPAKGRPPPPAVPLRMLMDALAAPGREASVPASIAAGFVRAALHGPAYPASILQRALLRERAEAGGDDWVDSARRDARAALLKGVLIRSFQQKVTPAMDPTNTAPGYLLGRLLAVLEDTQRLASGGVNASVKDKFYGAASATPAAVFPTLMDLFHKHARKLRESRPGAVVNREKQVDAILAGLSAVPVHLDLAGQGMFVLGYHHQRHALFNPAAADATGAAPAGAAGEPDAEAAPLG